MRQPFSPPADHLTEIMLAVFRLNARLLQGGDELVAPLNLTSARWQVLGAVGLGDGPMTSPQIADAMGISRQGAQKQINLMLEEGLLKAMDNPRHVRSPLYGLTRQGEAAFAATMELHGRWVKALSKGLSPAELKTTAQLLEKLTTRLETTPVPKKGVSE